MQLPNEIGVPVILLASEWREMGAPAYATDCGEIVVRESGDQYTVHRVNFGADEWTPTKDQGLELLDLIQPDLRALYE